MSRYFYRVSGEEFGPVPLDLIQREIACGQLTAAHEVRRGDETEWTRVEDFVKGLNQPSSTNQFATLQSDQLIFSWDGGHDDLNSETTVQSIPATTPFVPAAVESIPVSSDDSFTFPANVDQDAGLHFATESSAPKVESADPTPASVVHHAESASIATDIQWYVKMGRIERGPMEFQKLVEMAANGHILPTDRVRPGGTSEWTMARSVSGLFSSNAGSAQSSPPTFRPMARPSLAALINFEPKRQMTRGASPVAARQTEESILPLAASDNHHSFETPSEFSTQAYSVQSPAVYSMTRPVEPHRSSIDLAPVGVETDSADDPHDDAVPISLWPVASPERPATGESKHKLRRGRFQEPHVFDRRNVIVFACIGIIVLLFAAKGLIPVGAERFESSYLELNSICHTLEDKLAQKPTEEFWNVTRKEYVYKIQSVKQKVSNLRTRSLIRSQLLFAGDRMLRALKKSDSEVALCLREARAALIFSGEILQNAKNPPTQANPAIEEKVDETPAPSEKE